MKLTPEDVARVADLAKLNVDDGEAERYLADMTGILELVTELERIDVANVAPMAHPIEASQRLRVDKVGGDERRELFQSLTPHAARGLYWVPKVIE